MLQLHVSRMISIVCMMGTNWGSGLQSPFLILMHKSWSWTAEAKLENTLLQLQTQLHRNITSSQSRKCKESHLKTRVRHTMQQISAAADLCFLLTGAADIEDIVVINADISLLALMIMLRVKCQCILQWLHLNFTHSVAIRQWLGDVKQSMLKLKSISWK